MGRHEKIRHLMELQDRLKELGDRDEQIHT